jgi:peptidoglycan/xylan/chitin deacetylase (PgdA/CDA1 family)
LIAAVVAAGLLASGAVAILRLGPIGGGRVFSTRTASGGSASVGQQPQLRAVPTGRQRRRSLVGASVHEVARLLRLGFPLYCGGSRGHSVAFSFDDGPGPYTGLALRILRHAGAHATFFLVGRNLARGGSLPRLEQAVGGVGDHSWTHAFLPALSRQAMADELRQTQTAISRIVGAKVDLFRPPYGAHDPAIDAEARRLGMLEVLWSVDTRDSEGASWSNIAASVGRYAHPGSIILMHENRGQTIRALKFSILPALRRRGLAPVSIARLLAVDPPTLAQLRRGPRGCTGARSSG